MPASTPRVHDRFFKQIFTRPENIRDFITTYLPSALVSHLDLASLEVVDGSYVEMDLAEYFSDLVVRARLKQGNPADLYFVFEHKSGPDRYARVQVLRKRPIRCTYRSAAGYGRACLDAPSRPHMTGGKAAAYAGGIRAGSMCWGMSCLSSSLSLARGNCSKRERR